MICSALHAESRSEKVDDVACRNGGKGGVIRANHSLDG